jgi:glycosyltransferase involved in cell wall biosynthesis
VFRYARLSATAASVADAGPNTDSRDDAEAAAPSPGTGSRADGRLSFYIPSLAVGGAEQVTVSIVNGLVARGHDVDLVVSHPEGELRSAVADDVSVTGLGSTRVPVAGIGAHVPALARYLSRTEPAAVFAQKLDAGTVCLAANRLAGGDTKVIPTIHSAFGMASERTAKSRALDAFAARILASADHVVAVSEGVADSVAEATSVERADVSVLHNPVDVESVRERSREPVDDTWVEYDDVDLVLFVGRLERQKDLETWLRTFERVHRSNPDARAIIAGKGSRRERLRSLAIELGLDDVVSIPGYVDNPYRYMRNADVFLLSSRFEGLPTVLIEALACGCQVVATDCPCGPREILRSGEYGRLAPVGDAEGLAREVEESLSDPIPPERLEGRADEFAPEVVLNEYERFIDAYVFGR